MAFENNGFGERAPSGGRFSALLEDLLLQAERKYDFEVMTLIRAINLAEKKGDLKTLEAANQTALNWIAYFTSLKALIRRDCSPFAEDTEPAISFIEGQIRFLEDTSWRIENKIIGLKSDSLGFSPK